MPISDDLVDSFGSLFFRDHHIPPYMFLCLYHFPERYMKCGRLEFDRLDFSHSCRVTFSKHVLKRRMLPTLPEGHDRIRHGTFPYVHTFS